MIRDAERRERTQQALAATGLDLLVCTLPVNVLLLSGYWPVVGTSIALAARDGRLILLVPEDEQSLAQRGWADEIQVFHPGSLERLTNAEEAIREPLRKVAHALGPGVARVGYEHGASFEPVTYSSMHLYGADIQDILGLAFPFAAQVPADELLASLRAIKTPHEVGRIRTACSIAAEAFAEGARQLHAGLTEVEAAALFRTPLSTRATPYEDDSRADGFAWCMSGPNSALACGAYARSRGRKLSAGDFVLVHCNSYVDGYWTDITRTFCLGEPSPRQRAMYEAVQAATEAAIRTIRPGVQAREVDHAARQILAERGFGEQFKHSTGHGVGFAAINHNARPRLHPQSDDELQIGMVFNAEPAIYFADYGGLRHCDVVAVSREGAEVLTTFQSRIEELIRS